MDLRKNEQPVKISCGNCKKWLYCTPVITVERVETETKWYDFLTKKAYCPVCGDLLSLIDKELLNEHVKEN